jgi:glucokinase
MKKPAAIGADIGRLSLKIAVVDFAGEVISADSIPLDREQSKDYIISKLAGAVSEIRQKVAEKGINPVCIGISAKGFIDHQAGIVIGPDQGIKVGNDANLMTIAEHRFGAAKNLSNVIFVALRTGIGGGIIINGKLYRGVNNAGGEIGQMIINFSDGISDKGIKGSFEHFASASALVRQYSEVTGKSLKNEYRAPSCKEIFELSYKNDPAAVAVVNENADLVGIGLANLISIFAPEMIVLGGGMAEAGESYLEMIRKSAFTNSLENCRAEVKIEKALLGPGAALIGASYFSLSRLSGKVIW